MDEDVGGTEGAIDAGPCLTGEEVPDYVKMKGGIRFEYEVENRNERDLRYLCQALQEVCGLQKGEIYAILDYPKRGVYDVVVKAEGIYRDLLVALKRSARDPRWFGIKITPHFKEEQILVVKAYSPYLACEDLMVFLRRYCEDVRCLGRVLNECGVWASKWRFAVKFKENQRPPARFRLGRVNCDIFFAGMGLFCRNCKEYGHVKEDCSATYCPNCEELGHEFKDCPKGKTCNLCHAGTHLFAECPLRKKEDKSKEQKNPGKRKYEESHERTPQAEKEKVPQEKAKLPPQKKEEEKPLPQKVEAVKKKSQEKSSPQAKKKSPLKQPKYRQRDPSPEISSSSEEDVKILRKHECWFNEDRINSMSAEEISDFGELANYHVQLEFPGNLRDRRIESLESFVKEKKAGRVPYFVPGWLMKVLEKYERSKKDFDLKLADMLIICRLRKLMILETVLRR